MDWIEVLNQQFDVLSDHLDRSQDPHIYEIWVDRESKVIEIRGTSEQKVWIFIQKSGTTLPESGFRALEGDPFVLM